MAGFGGRFWVRSVTASPIAVKIDAPPSRRLPFAEDRMGSVFEESNSPNPSTPRSTVPKSRDESGGAAAADVRPGFPAECRRRRGRSGRAGPCSRRRRHPASATCRRGPRHPAHQRRHGHGHPGEMPACGRAEWDITPTAMVTHAVRRLLLNFLMRASAVLLVAIPVLLVIGRPQGIDLTLQESPTSVAVTGCKGRGSPSRRRVPIGARPFRGSCTIGRPTLPASGSGPSSHQPTGPAHRASWSCRGGFWCSGSGPVPLRVEPCGAGAECR